ncbi:MAG: ankyrin repeat domain-containing protein [Candidatus Aminicenantes bacterium]|nr:ankyrin repeat domain-containing protein [Candidatus Aminicenantes bacterium]
MTGHGRRRFPVALALALSANLAAAGAAARPPEDAAKRLCRAAREGDVPTVVKVLRVSPDAVAEADQFGYTALHWAALCGRREVLDLLLAAGA